MKTKYLIFVILALFGLNTAIIAQEKYALLIGGDMQATNVPTEHRWNGGPGVQTFDEFWNDTYLMWELLYDEESFYGYSNDNINVLFGDGADYTFSGQWERYKAIYHNLDFITDDTAKKSDVMSALDGYTTLTENDYMFIWIMSNGGNTIPEDGGDSYFYLWGYDPGNPNAGRLYDYELKAKLDLIPAQKKVVIVQAPNSGGFAKILAGNPTVHCVNNVNEFFLKQSSFQEDKL
jgi:hypothetical protein